MPGLQIYDAFTYFPKISIRKALKKSLLKSPVLIHEASDEGAWFDPGPRFDAQWWIGATCSGHSPNPNIDLFYFSTFLLLDRGNLLRSPSPNYHIDPFCFFKSLISAQLTLILSHDFNLLQFIIPGHHNTNHYGNWTWDEAGKELEWFDWLQDEPNDYETQK